MTLTFDELIARAGLPTVTEVARWVGVGADELRGDEYLWAVVEMTGRDLTEIGESLDEAAGLTGLAGMTCAGSA